MRQARPTHPSSSRACGARCRNRRSTVLCRVTQYAALAGIGAGVIVGCRNEHHETSGDAVAPVPAATLDGCDPGLILQSVDEPVRVSLWHPETDTRAQVLTDLVAEFDRDSPAVEVSLEYVNTTDLLMTRWREAAPDDRPTLALLPQQLTRRLADSGQTVAPGECFAQAIPDAVPAIAATWTIDGVPQAMPFAVSTPVLFYNRLLFVAAGLDPDRPPATMDELTAVSEQLVASGVAKYGLVVDNNAGGLTTWIVEHWNARAGRLTLEPDNGRGGTPSSRAGWRDGSAVESFTWLERMVERKLAKSIDNFDGRQDLVDAGDPAAPIGMTIHTCGSLGELIDYLASHAEFSHIDLDVAPLPGPGPGAGSLPGGDAMWMAAGLSAEERAAAWALEMWLTSPSAQARWAAATGYVPVTQAAPALEPLAQRWRDHPELAIAYDAVLQVGAGQADLGMQAGPEPEISQALARAYQRILRGAPVAEALADAADTTDALLDTYARMVPSSRRRRGSNSG
jgi:sn-glycerol 3-phosphate transport system substrate-binding protein